VRRAHPGFGRASWSPGSASCGAKPSTAEVRNSCWKLTDGSCDTVSRPGSSSSMSYEQATVVMRRREAKPAASSQRPAASRRATRDIQAASSRHPDGRHPSQAPAPARPAGTQPGRQAPSRAGRRPPRPDILPVTLSRASTSFRRGTEIKPRNYRRAANSLLKRR
jgi:hypothetical protein